MADTWPGDARLEQIVAGQGFEALYEISLWQDDPTDRGREVVAVDAAMGSALEVAKRPESRGKQIVTIIPSCGERYLSTWLYEEN